MKESRKEPLFLLAWVSKVWYSEEKIGNILQFVKETKLFQRRRIYDRI
jgi:hypothetical protein